MKRIISVSKTTGLIALAITCCLFYASCQRSSKNVQEKMIEKALEKESGEKANVNIEDEKAVIEVGNSRMEVDGKATTWPDEIPSEVPEFKFGKIKGVITNTEDGQKSWTVSYEDIQAGYLDKYNEQLKGKGFETSIFKYGDKGGSITAENAGFYVSVIGSEDYVTVSISNKN